jgi:hypothetical protein
MKKRSFFWHFFLNNLKIRNKLDTVKRGNSDHFSTLNLITQAIVKIELCSYVLIDISWKYLSNMQRKIKLKWATLKN